MQTFCARTVFPVIVCLISVAVAAAAPPDAGTLLQEQRQPGMTLPQRLPGERGQEVVKPPLKEEGIRVLVNGFRFTGTEGIATDAELQKLVQTGIGRELGLSELQKLAAAVTSYLRGKGYPLARAYLPQQDVTEGIIEIAILSGRIEGKPRINLKEPSRVDPSLLEGIAGRAVPAGEPLRLERIERAVLLMNDLPGISSNAFLEAGTAPGSTKLVIDAAEGPLLHGHLSGDNFGDRYTGAYRATGQLSVSDPFGLGDELGLSLTGAEDLVQWRAAYTIPLRSTGLTGNLVYTGLAYKLGKEFKDLAVEGRAATVSANIGYALLRSRNATIRTGLGFELLMLKDEALGATTADRKLSVGSASVSGNFSDSFGGGGLTSAAVIVSAGDVDLSGLAANDTRDAAGPRASGGFSRGTYSVARLQRLTRLITLFGSARGQIAQDNLDSSQKFILGGTTGVRAYPVGEAPGDEGHIVTFEARLDLPSMSALASTQFIGFYDAGWIKLHKDPWPGSIANASGSNRYWLSGAGAGIVIGTADSYSIRAYYAHKIGTNGGRNAQGMDADNRDDNGRFWLQLVVWL